MKKIIVPLLLVMVIMLSASVLAWGASRSINGYKVMITVTPGDGFDTFTITETVTGATIQEGSFPPLCSLAGNKLTCDYDENFEGIISYQTNAWTGTVSGSIVGVNSNTFADASQPITGNTQITPYVCGNGVKEGAEQCDDKNTAGGDGCSLSCQVESGYKCTGEPSVCQKEVAPVSSQQCLVLGDYNKDGITSSADTVKFNWHVSFGDSLLASQKTYAGDTCGASNQAPCAIGNTGKYICDDGTGLAANANSMCTGGCIVGDYNKDGITSSADTVKFNWHVLFGDSLLTNQKTYASDTCGASTQAPCAIGNTGKYICDDGTGLAANANAQCK